MTQKEVEQQKQINHLQKQIKDVEKKVEVEKQKNASLTQEVSNLNKIKRTTVKRAKEFHNEFNKTVNTGIVAAFGILLGLTWKDVITESLAKTTVLTQFQSQLAEAVIITIIATLAIYTMAKLFPVEKKA